MQSHRYRHNQETLLGPDGFDNLGPAISLTNMPVILDICQ